MLKNLSKKDIYILIVLTFVFAVLIFYRIGAKTAPESFHLIESRSNNGIIVDFQDGVHIRRIYIYSGPCSEVPIDITFQGENSDTTRTKTQNSFTMETSIKNPFRWEIYECSTEAAGESSDKAAGEVERIYISCKGTEAYIGELVFLDDKGQTLLPDNADMYPVLFDEQEKFVKNPDYFHQTVFDEVLYARSAYELIHGMPVCEKTHPPLGKLIIDLGVRIFGITPWGWRFSSALFAVIMIPLVYILALCIFKETPYATFSAVLLMTQFMNYTLGRIATLDTIVADFILAAFLCIYCFSEELRNNGTIKKQKIWLFFTGLFMGLAIATKWTGCYAAVGIVIWNFISEYNHVKGEAGMNEVHASNRLRRTGNEIFAENELPIHIIRGEAGMNEVHASVIRNRKYITNILVFCFFSMIALPVLVYIISYIPYLRAIKGQNLFNVVGDSIRTMFSFHIQADSPHPCESEWYKWLIDTTPVKDSVTYYKNGTVRVVETFLNPLICIGGLLALVHNLYLLVRKKSREAGFLLIAYFAMLVPWMFITRTVFIYQYFVPAIFLILIIANSVKNTKRKMLYIYIIASFSVIIFIMFFPVISGYRVDTAYITAYLQWLPDWSL